MNIHKYIELLRFYLIEKIDDIHQSLEKTLKDEIDDIIKSILSSILALFISIEFIEIEGVWGSLFKIVLTVSIYLLMRYIILAKIYRKVKTKKEIKEADGVFLTPVEAKRLIDKFDHIACDSLLLAWDFLDKSKKIKSGREHEKSFCIIEAFYYYKKSLDIVFLIIYNSKSCINNERKKDGISKYRLSNVYNSLSDINDNITQYMCLINVDTSEFEHEKKQYDKKLNTIKKYLSSPNI